MIKRWGTITVLRSSAYKVCWVKGWKEEIVPCYSVRNAINLVESIIAGKTKPSYGYTRLAAGKRIE